MRCIQLPTSHFRQLTPVRGSCTLLPHLPWCNKPKSLPTTLYVVFCFSPAYAGFQGSRKMYDVAMLYKLFHITSLPHFDVK